MTCALLLVIPLTLGAPGLKDPPKKQSSVVGVWVVESYTIAGRPRPVGVRSFRYEFTADGKWYLYRGERKSAIERAYYIDPKADPPHIDLNYDPSDQDPPMAYGIYKVDGDTLTLCLVRNKGPRPTDFLSTPDTRASLYVFKRAKD
jgi:uncharacterized protein (TIGR03067 family)